MHIIRPVQPSNRIYALDVLRGFSLFGVLWAFTSFEFGTASQETYSRAEYYFGWAMEFFRDNKFYPILAFLFGLGFSLQLNKTAKALKGLGFYWRRLAALFLLGIVYALTLRDNILLTYAFCGLLLVPLRRAGGWLLFAIGLLVFLYSIVTIEFLNATGMQLPALPGTGKMQYLSGKFLLLQQDFIIGPFYWLGSLPLVLLGFYAGREAVFSVVSQQKNKLLLIALFGFITGLFAFILREYLFIAWKGITMDNNQKWTLRFLWWLAAWTVGASYMAIILVLLLRPAWQQLLKPFSFVGRMALTNYILQGLVLVPVCFALDLFNRPTPITALVAAMGFYTLQAWLSYWWLCTHKTGPVEGLLHSFVYKREKAPEPGHPGKLVKMD